MRWRAENSVSRCFLLPDLSEAPRLGSVNLLGCVPTVEDEEGD